MDMVLQNVAKLYGSIPSEIGNLVNLEFLKISNSNMEGPIPPSIGNLTALTELDLSFNNLSGVIPQVIWDLPNLTVINLSNNQINGLLPTTIANASNFLEINLQNNEFVGTMPAVFGQLVELNYLSLRYNNLYGELPNEFCGIGSNNVYNGETSGDWLRVFLQDNNFSEVPSCICDMDYLLLNFYNSLGGNGAFGDNEFCPPYPSCAVGYAFFG